MPEPQKLLLVGDTHADTKWVTKIIRHAKSIGVDTIFQLGDFGFWPTHYVRYLDTVQRVLNDSDITMYWLDGNHEDHGLLKPGLALGRLQHVPRGHRWQWWGKTWMAVGGGVSVDRKMRTAGRDWFPEETLTREQLERCLAPGAVNVILSHDCPDGVDIPGLTPDRFPEEDIRASEGHRELIGEICNTTIPSKLFHGHYHVNYTAHRGVTTIYGLDCNGSSMSRGTITMVKSDLDT